MHYLFILNDPPYGTERSYNGLRMTIRPGQGRRKQGFGVSDRRRGVMRSERAGHAERLLQHRTDAENTGLEGRENWRLRKLYGRPRPQGGDARRRRAPEHMNSLHGRRKPNRPS